MTSQRQRLLGRRAPGARWRLLILTSGALLLAALMVAVSLVYQSADMMLEQIHDDFNQQQLILARQAAAQVNAELGDIEVDARRDRGRQAPDVEVTEVMLENAALVLDPVRGAHDVQRHLDVDGLGHRDLLQVEV